MKTPLAPPPYQKGNADSGLVQWLISSFRELKREVIEATSRMMQHLQKHDEEIGRQEQRFLGLAQHTRDICLQNTKTNQASYERLVHWIRQQDQVIQQLQADQHLLSQIVANAAHDEELGYR